VGPELCVFVVAPCSGAVPERCSLLKRMRLDWQTEEATLSLAKQDMMLYGIGSPFVELCKASEWRMKRCACGCRMVMIVQLQR